MINLLAACSGGSGGNDSSGTTATPPPLPIATVPGAPTIGAVTAGDASASVAFTPPASSGGGPITGYTAICVVGGANGGAANSATGTTSPITVANLINANAYACTVAAMNALGTGAASQSVLVTPVAPPPITSVPGAPTIAAITAGDAIATISFTAPSSNGGSAITSYTASCIASGTAKTVTASGSPIIVTGLTNATTYSCTLMASNAVGNSAISPAASVTPVAGSTASGAFKLTSTAAIEGGTMPMAFTCDGTKSSMPLAWSNAPAGTVAYALLMTTLPGDGTTKWNWVLYNIPASTTALALNTSGVGTLGTADDGAGNAYAPPCSQGPGAKTYTFTVYALSAPLNLTATASQTGGLAVSAAIKPFTLGVSALNVSYARATTTPSTTAAVNCAFINNSMAGYAATVGVDCTASDYGKVASLGLANHPMMNGIVASNLQMPLAQNFLGSNAWKIPLTPAIAANTTAVNDGPIGIAINGVPIFNPCKQGGCQNGDTKVLGELDICNGHAGRADDYHYHAAPTCLMAENNQVASYWNTHPIGWALDGFAIFGFNNADGSVATRDAICGGNTLTNANAPAGYRYHVTNASPYIMSCLRGTPSPDLAGQGAKYKPIRQPPVTPFAVSNMTLSTSPSDDYQVLQFTSAISFISTETGTDRYVNPPNTYRIRYKQLSGTELATVLALPTNSGKTACWNFQFTTVAGATTQPTIAYCR